MPVLRKTYAESENSLIFQSKLNFVLVGKDAISV